MALTHQGLILKPFVQEVALGLRKLSAVQHYDPPIDLSKEDFTGKRVRVRLFATPFHDLFWLSQSPLCVCVCVCVQVRDCVLLSSLRERV